MIKIICKNVDEVGVLIDFIKENYSNDYRRLWSLENQEIGVFLHEHIGVIVGNVFTIMTLLDFDKSSKICEISVRYVGGALSLIGTGKSEDFISKLATDITKLADEKGWTYDVQKIKIRPAGSKCPHCGAAYKYPREKRREDGSVDCQNCGKSFVPD